jgi:hypothetical protein
MDTTCGSGTGRRRLEPDDGQPCAVKAADRNPRFRRGKLGEMLPGHRSDRMVKTLRDKSMVEKREAGEHARPVVPQGPRDKVKAGLLEPQTPGMERHIHRHGMYGRCRRDRTVTVSPFELSSRRATASEAVQGVERGTYVALGRSIRPDTGSPTGREAQGDGAAVVVRGRESRPHGEGPQVLDDQV